jgi:hypothetical protein
MMEFNEGLKTDVRKGFNEWECCQMKTPGNNVTRGMIQQCTFPLSWFLYSWGLVTVRNEETIFLHDLLGPH